MIYVTIILSDQKSKHQGLGLLGMLDLWQGTFRLRSGLELGFPMGSSPSRSSDPKSRYQSLGFDWARQICYGTSSDSGLAWEWDSPRDAPLLLFRTQSQDTNAWVLTGHIRPTTGHLPTQVWPRSETPCAQCFQWGKIFKMSIFGF